MFCTTECWDCEDKNCRNYISKSELYFENQQLKEELQKADSITQSCIFDGKEESKINFRKAINLIEQYKSVLDEIREYIKEHKDYLEKAKEMYIGCNDELLKSTCIQLINNELVRNDNLLQILDKVKEYERGTESTD